jgi:hypothetical protein
MRRLATALLLAGLLGGCSIGDDPGQPPQLGVGQDDSQATAKLGFPSSATRNTIRVGGADVAADAAGVAGALFPSTGSFDRPTAVALVDEGDWQTAVAASVLAGPPIGAPLLLSDGGDLPSVSQDTLDQLQPKGSDLSKDAQVIRVGDDVAHPGGYRTAVIQGDDAFQRAAAIDRFFSAARGKPSGAVVVYSADSPAWAMPAASWAARSGDAALPVHKNSIPPAIAKALASHEGADVYLLGPPSVISASVEKELRTKKLARSVNRISARTPVESAIAFARYEKGDFGWGIVVPGYNFAIANVDRPLDAAAAASLATRGVFAPLLLTDNSDALPPALERYLLSVQPGYEDDPAQAVYNRAWILGDDKAVSVNEQARVDATAELIPVQSNAP